MKWLRLIVMGAVVCALGVGSLQAALVSYYTFDDAADLGADATGTNNGTPVGDATQGPGKVGTGSLVLDGDGDIVNVAGAASFDAVDDDGDGWTLAAWVKAPADATGDDGVMRVFSMYNPTEAWMGEGWGLGIDRADPAQEKVMSTTYGIVDMRHDSDPLPDDEWTHLDYVYQNDGGNAATDFYVNGVLLGTTTTGSGFGINDTTNDYVIGALGFSGHTQFWQGSIDELRVYDTPLTADQIGALVPEPTSIVLFGIGLGLVLAGFAGKNRK